MTDQNSQFDIAIIGAGCVGAAIAQRLAEYDVRVALLEKEEDVAMSSSKANSGIIHAGYFTPEGSMKEKMNLLGNPMFDVICPQIGVEFARIGATFCATTPEEVQILKDEQKIADKRKVPTKFIDDKKAIKELEPGLGENVLAVLFYPTAGIVIPFELTIGLAEHAIMNGTKLYLHFEVSSIAQIVFENYNFLIKAKDGRQIFAKTVINAAGLYSDKIASMVGLSDFSISPRKGEYILFDKNAIPIKTIVFPTPSKESKGILVAPTLHGNIYIGPNAHEVQDREGLSTTTAGLNEIIIGAKKIFANIPIRQAITNFAGLRPTPSTHDFIIGQSKVSQFVNAAGIESPGLSSCLAIAAEIDDILRRDCGYSFKVKENYIPTRPKTERYGHLTEDQLAQKIRKNPQWGQMICRCELVTEAEIVQACHAPIPASNVDMIKRRLRAGMGRCQGGFCMPKIMKIISREQKIVLQDVTKKGDGSFIVLGRIKKLPYEVYMKKEL